MNEYRAGDGLVYMIQMILSSGKKCQLPLDGSNTDSFTKAMIPLAQHGRESTGELITYTFDWYVWRNEQCVFEYYMDAQVDISNTMLKVNSASRRRNGEMCAINLYIQAEECGRRCEDEMLVFYLYAGQKLEPPSSKLDGFVGLSYVLVSDYLGAFDYNSTQNLVTVGMVAYAIEIIDDFTQNEDVKAASDAISLVAFAGAFPIWAWKCYELF